MGWIKLDHILLNHSKVWAAPEAFGLYCAGLLYADIQSTNGIIPDHAIGHLLPLKKIDQLKRQLIDVGLWVEVEGGVEIFAYLKHNRSAEEIAELKAKRAASGAIGGSKRQANAKQTLKQTASNQTESVQAEKNREEKTREDKALKAMSSDDDGFESFWSEYPSQNWPAVPNPKPGKTNAKTQWKRLNRPEQSLAKASLPHYKAYLELTGQQTKHCERYLQQKAFNAYQQPPTPAPGPSGNDPPKGRNARAFEAVIQRMGVSNESGTSTASHEVPQRSLPEGRVEPGALHALG